MKRLQLKRRFSAIVLLAVMLPMLAVVSLHHHELPQQSVELSCQDCLHHAHHAGHLTTASLNVHDCVLCQLQSLPFLNPTATEWAPVTAFMGIVFMAYASPCLLRKADALSTRAPPYYNL